MIANIPTVSIIVPCYNHAEFLKEALQSVLKQTYSNWECLIINDGSTDNTEEVAKSFCKTDQRFKYISKINGGVANTRNVGIANAAGTYILPLDDDDVLGEQYLERALKVFDDAPYTTLVYTQANLFGEKNEPWILRPYSYAELLKSNMVHNSSIFKRQDFLKTGGYDESLTKGYEDWDLFIRLLNNDSIVYRLNDVHFHYRIKPVSRSTAIDLEIHEELNHYIYRKYQDRYKAHFGNPIDMIRTIELYEIMYKNSTDYKFGNAILTPVRNFLNTLKSIVK